MSKRYFESLIEVRYRDTDSMGHVAAPVYCEYMLHAYLAFMHALLEVPTTEELPHIMIKTSCEYIKPAKYGDLITVRSGITRFWSKRFDLEYKMIRNGGAGTLIAQGASSHVMFDYSNHMSIPIPDGFKEGVMRFQGEV